MDQNTFDRLSRSVAGAWDRRLAGLASAGLALWQFGAADTEAGNAWTRPAGCVLPGRPARSVGSARSVAATTRRQTHDTGGWPTSRRHHG